MMLLLGGPGLIIRHTGIIYFSDGVANLKVQLSLFKVYLVLGGVPVQPVSDIVTLGLIWYDSIPFTIAVCHGSDYKELWGEKSPGCRGSASETFSAWQ